MNGPWRKIRLKEAKWLLAAAFLAVAVIDLGGHAVTIYTETGAWCAPFHYNNSGVDCPHKRDHKTPEKTAFDETTLLAVDEALAAPQAAEVAFSVDLPAAPAFRFVTRSLDPPFQPPKTILIV